MSCNRENVTWRSRDGSWNRGFFEFYSTGDDHEWDVEYEYDRFHWVSLGHATQQEANLSWTGSNPGGGRIYSEPSDKTDAFDTMATTCSQELEALNREIALRRHLRSWCRSS